MMISLKVSSLHFPFLVLGFASLSGFATHSQEALLSCNERKALTNLYMRVHSALKYFAVVGLYIVVL